MWQYNSPDELCHYGVKGMKWGVRKQQSLAKKDAKEYARAKMFYGEGAGNRRKLIRSTVNQRSKEEVYKKAFDEALAKQDMASHATKARHERSRKDLRNKTGKTGRGVINIVNGHPERAGAALIATYGILKVSGLDKKILELGKTGTRRVINEISKRVVK